MPTSIAQSGAAQTIVVEVWFVRIGCPDPGTAYNHRMVVLPRYGVQPSDGGIGIVEHMHCTHIHVIQHTGHASMQKKNYGVDLRQTTCTVVPIWARLGERQMARL